MLKNRNFGIALIVVGVVLNNLSYLIDLTRPAQQGLIYLGSKGVIGVVVGILLILAGIVVMVRAGGE